MLSVLGGVDVPVVSAVHGRAVGGNVSSSCVTFVVRLLLNRVLLVYRAPSAVPGLCKGHTAGASAVSLQLLHKVSAWRFRGEFMAGRELVGHSCHRGV